MLFEQVLFNLLDNAGKYAPVGSTVTLRAWHEPAQGGAARASGTGNPDATEAKFLPGHIVLQVIDEGTGIPDEALERVFDKFYRVRGADRQRAGTGLGLAVCRGFVEAMGGTITAANRQDRSGAIFTLKLPVLAQPVAA